MNEVLKYIDTYSTNAIWLDSQANTKHLYNFYAKSDQRPYVENAGPTLYKN